MPTPTLTSCGGISLHSRGTERHYFLLRNPHKRHTQMHRGRGDVVLCKEQWFHLQWPTSWASMHISPKELAPIVIAIAVWDAGWAGQRICCYSDNMAVVYTINKESARDPQLMRLLRALFFLSATFNVTITARHIPGVQNASADALSRNNMNTFHTLNPQASPQPTQVPDALQELVLNHNLRWTSPTWTRLFESTLGTVLPPTPQHRYMAFCSSMSIAQAFPVTERTLSRFAALLGQQNINHRTIKSFPDTAGAG